MHTTSVEAPVTRNAIPAVVSPADPSVQVCVFVIALADTGSVVASKSAVYGDTLLPTLASIVDTVPAVRWTVYENVYDVPAVRVVVLVPALGQPRPVPPDEAVMHQSFVPYPPIVPWYMNQALDVAKFPSVMRLVPPLDELLLEELEDEVVPLDELVLLDAVPLDVDELVVPPSEAPLEDEEVPLDVVDPPDDVPEPLPLVEPLLDVPPPLSAKVGSLTRGPQATAAPSARNPQGEKAENFIASR
jgi:hypothetical protein